MIWPAELVHENVRKVLAKKTLILCATYFFNKTDQILFNVAFPHKYCPPNKCFGKSKQTPGSPVREAGRQAGVSRWGECRWTGVVREGGCPCVARAVVLRRTVLTVPVTTPQCCLSPSHTTKGKVSIKCSLVNLALFINHYWELVQQPLRQI